MTNVRANDWAMIVASDFPANVGAVVRVDSLASPADFWPAPTPDEHTMWACIMFSEGTMCWGDAFLSEVNIPGDVNAIGDSRLRPILPGQVAHAFEAHRLAARRVPASAEPIMETSECSN